jgi:putative endonuclease
MPSLASLRTWLAKRFPPKSLGQRGEDTAAKFLKRRGYKILARGHDSRLGELDIIAVDGRTLVFVEVKTRRNTEAGHPSEAVDDHKQKRLTQSALAYLKGHHLLGYAARFDVVAVTWPDETSQPTVEHFLDAFAPVGTGQLFS